MSRKRFLFNLTLLIGAAAIGAWAHYAFAAGTVRPLPIPPKIAAGKFKPDPVIVGLPTIARMTGIATAPEKVDIESLTSLNWAWHIDKVQLKLTADGTYTTPPASSYEASITALANLDANAVLVLKPKTAGSWKVTVHATATYANVGGEIFTGNSEPKEFLVTAIAKPDTQPSQPPGGGGTVPPITVIPK